MTTSAPGLRERKRTETRARIEDAALSLALRDGLDAATIDAISERADISPRTFFNYFDSKESAILGVHPIEVTDELADQYLSTRTDESLIPSIVHLLFAVMGSPLSRRPTQHADRLEAIRRHPEVLRGQMDQLHARTGRLTHTIEQLVATSATTPVPEADRRAHAEMLLALCGSAARIAVREWSEAAHDDTTHIERRAVALVEQIRGTIV